ncbi:hypothetical protein ACVLV4_000721 [Rathayibacter agropyri]
MGFFERRRLGNDRPRGSWPQIGNVHRNGERQVGIESGPVDPFYAAGTPPVQRLYHSTVSPAIAGVRIDDALDVSFDGVKHWWAYLDGERLGRLTWSVSDGPSIAEQDPGFTYPTSGVLRVMKLLLCPTDKVVNCGGFVYPR